MRAVVLWPREGIRGRGAAMAFEEARRRRGVSSWDAGRTKRVRRSIVFCSAFFLVLFFSTLAGLVMYRRYMCMVLKVP